MMSESIPEKKAQITDVAPLKFVFIICSLYKG